ncbi:MAG: hypothetical protein ACRDLB_16730 [Actinomycetota bacterium]
MDKGHKRDLANVYLDLVLVGVLLGILATSVALIAGDFEPLGLASAIFFYGCFALAAYRLGTTPVAYLKESAFRRRWSSP